MTGTTDYRSRSKAFLVKAREEWAAGDLEQASEKAWGAAALMLKEVAHQRGLEHESHNHLFGVLRVLVRESGDRGLRPMFRTANDLHHNFYEDRLTADEVDDDIKEVEQFVGRVERFI